VNKSINSHLYIFFIQKFFLKAKIQNVFKENQEVSLKDAFMMFYMLAILSNTLLYRLIANTAGVMANHEALIVS